MDRRILEVDIAQSRVEERSVSVSSLYALEKSVIENLSGRIVLTFSGNILRASYLSPRNGNRITETTSCEFARVISQKGISAVIISGKASKLSFLDISESGIEIHLCEKLKFSSPHTFKKLLGENPSDCFISIGKAGEMKAPLSSLVLDTSFIFGHGGIGAVFGQMNLKGIILRNRGEVKNKEREGKRKSKLRSRIDKEGWLTLVNEAFMNGWAPVKNFSGRKDPRLLHLSSANFERVMDREEDAPIDLFSTFALGSNLGFFDPVKVQFLFEGCLALGLDPISVGYVLANVKYQEKLEYPFPDLYNADVDDILSLLDEMAEMKGFGELFNSLAIKLLEDKSFFPLCDLRGSLMMALSYALDDLYPFYADLALGLSRKFSNKNIGLIYAYLRLYYLYQIDNGISPDLALVSVSEILFKFVPDNAFLLRASLSSLVLGKMKDKALAECALEKLSEEKLGNLPKFFTTTIGENDYTDEIKEKELGVAYLLEIDIIRSRYEKKKK